MLDELNSNTYNISVFLPKLAEHVLTCFYCLYLGEHHKETDLNQLNNIYRTLMDKDELYTFTRQRLNYIINLLQDLQLQINEDCSHDTSYQIYI